MPTIRFSSGLSTIADPFCLQLADLLTGALGVEVTWVAERPSQGWMRDSDFDLLWACGFLHASNLVAGSWPYRAIAAPAMRPARYGGTAVYFGDVIVRTADPANDLRSLRNRVFAFNEEESFSGYQMLLRSPMVGNDRINYLNDAIRTGSHAASIDAVLDGSADWAVIDSTVIDMVAHPEIRVAGSLGPYPAPPMLVSEQSDRRLISDVEKALAGLSSDNSAEPLFKEWNLASFVSTSDDPYLGLLG